MASRRQDGDSIYEVYLVDADVAGATPVSSPVRTRDIRYYDSGIWVRDDDGRTFYPYAQVRRIDERDIDRGEHGEGDDAHTGGDADRRRGDWRDQADPNLNDDDLGSDTVPADEL